MSSEITPATEESFRLAQPVQSYWQAVWRRLKRNKPGLLAAIVLLLMVLISFVGPLIWSYDANQIRATQSYATPTWEHPLGGDKLGRDNFARVMQGGTVSLSIGLAVALIATVLGMTIEIVSGYVGGLVDEILMRVLDGFHALPRIAILLLLSSLIGPSFWTMLLILSGFAWTGTARIARGIVLSLKERPFVEAGRGLGASHQRLMIRHILPHSASAMIVAATLEAASAIRSEATLSFLGLGIQPPMASWGNLLSDSQSYFWIAPWQVLYPGVAILISLMCFNLLGDALRDALDPLSKQTHVNQG